MPNGPLDFPRPTVRRSQWTILLEWRYNNPFDTCLTCGKGLVNCKFNYFATYEFQSISGGMQAQILLHRAMTTKWWDQSRRGPKVSTIAKIRQYVWVPKTYPHTWLAYEALRMFQFTLILSRSTMLRTYPIYGLHCRLVFSNSEFLDSHQSLRMRIIN
jgi:hypothetical protein